MEPFTNVVPNL